MHHFFWPDFSNIFVPLPNYKSHFWIVVFSIWSFRWRAFHQVLKIGIKNNRKINKTERIWKLKFEKSPIESGNLDNSRFTSGAVVRDQSKLVTCCCRHHFLQKWPVSQKKKKNRLPTQLCAFCVDVVPYLQIKF